MQVGFGLLGWGVEGLEEDGKVLVGLGLEHLNPAGGEGVAQILLSHLPSSLL